MKKSVSRLGQWGVAIAAGLMFVCSAVWADDTIYLKNKSSMVGKNITWRDSAQEYQVETPEGVIIPVAKSQVERLDIEKPADFEKAAKMVEMRQNDAAIPLLEGIVTAYKMRVWDNKARELLAEAYLAKADGKKALSTVEAVFETSPKAEASPELLRVYWSALMAAQKTATLKTELDQAVSTGAPELAAEAQLMRGDLNRAAGNKEEALLDYLRTVILFEQVKTVQPEALFKAAQMLDDLRDTRGADLRKKLASTYPDSKYAKQLKPH